MKGQADIQTVIVDASTEHLAEVRNLAAEKAMECGFSKSQVSDIRLAVDEAFTNIIKHAYQNNGHFKVKLELSCKDGRLSISLFDSGQSFSLENYEEPDVKQRVRHKERGGVGVYLIKKLMDSVEYLTHDSANEIRMTKNAKR